MAGGFGGEGEIGRQHYNSSKIFLGDFKAVKRPPNHTKG